MKKIAFTMASLLVATGAMAAGEDASLTTKNYVDSGLRAVYNVASGAASQAQTNAIAIEALQNTVQNIDYSGKADQADLEALQTTVAGKADADSVYTKTEANERFLTSEDIADIDGTAYTGTNGVSISNHQVGLNVTTETGKMYVYTENGWTELPIEDTWDASILTSGN